MLVVHRSEVLLHFLSSTGDVEENKVDFFRLKCLDEISEYGSV